LTLKELADRIGVTEATAQKYESGNIKKVDVEMLKKLYYNLFWFSSENIKAVKDSICL